MHLPGQDMRRFASLFGELEARAASLGVAAYGVSCTTLEDVFLRINANSLERLAVRQEELQRAAGPGPAGRCSGPPTMAQSQMALPLVI